MTKFFDEHLNFRLLNHKQTEKFEGITAVELNVTELCNRTCSFCPRHDPKVYPNQKLHMSLDTVKIIKQQLKGFLGHIQLTGFGEPTLNPNILDICNILKEFNIEVVTNGDCFTKNKLSVEQLTNAGVNNILISDYDKNPFFKDLERKHKEVIVRRHYDDGTDRYEEYKFTNRGGLMFDAFTSNPCYYPSYQIIVDWNGDLILCCNDWLRKQKPFGNVHKDHILNIWNNEEYRKIRKNLLEGKRLLHDPCKSCNANGVLMGKESALYWKDKLENSDA